jgi:alanine racemase
MSRPTVAIIDRQALRSNLALANSLAPNSKTMPMVKANAYGHGALEVCRTLVDEALSLRSTGVAKPILLLEGTFSADEVAVAADHNFWLMVENEPQKQAILTSTAEKKVTVWLGIDTGMHRLGFQPEDIDQHYQQLRASDKVAETIVLASHFACADDLQSMMTPEQIECFNRCVTKGDISSDNNVQFSLANSAAILGWPESYSHWHRPGYMIYGNSPFSMAQNNADQLIPVMTFQSAIISLRQVKTGESVGYTRNWTAQRLSTIATVTVGYGDGYPRQAPNGTPVLINGFRCPIVGRVSMDMITVDVSELSSVAIGDKVILWGTDLLVSEVADYCDTTGYELLTRMPSRVPRKYIN